MRVQTLHNDATAINTDNCPKSYYIGNTKLFINDEFANHRLLVVSLHANIVNKHKHVLQENVAPPNSHENYPKVT